MALLVHEPAAIEPGSLTFLDWLKLYPLLNVNPRVSDFVTLVATVHCRPTLSLVRTMFSMI